CPLLPRPGNRLPVAPAPVVPRPTPTNRRRCPPPSRRLYRDGRGARAVGFPAPGATAGDGPSWEPCLGGH
ncbi:MAG: hypothetical protein AVDCRST_MAG73-1946, partial [uncultured Thermomicrobiales bacterium]